MSKSNITGKIKRRQIWAKTKGICAHCGANTASKYQTIDHYVPKSWGGGDDRRNLIPLCKECNQERGNRQINPVSYYTYASELVVNECIEYENEWFAKRINYLGEIIM